jgi:hypothetical protein
MLGNDHSSALEQSDALPKSTIVSTKETEHSFDVYQSKAKVSGLVVEIDMFFSRKKASL